MARVTKAHPCKHCGHDTWCMSGEKFDICMRVASPKPITMKGGEEGWLHARSNGEAPRPVRRAQEAPVINVEKMMNEWAAMFSLSPLVELSVRLGVHLGALQSLECIRAPVNKDTFAFPMKDGKGGYVGIRLRNMNGEKWAVAGSHAGLFIPNDEPQDTVWILEGPTDTAAALTIGLYAVGRPSCSGGIDHIKTLLPRIKAKRVVIVADCDQDKFTEDGKLKVNPGARGAQTLSEHISIPSAVMMLPAKDMRAFVNSGGTKQMLESQLSQLVWRHP